MTHLLLNGVLAWVFVESGLSKLRDMGTFRAALEDYRVLRSRPRFRSVAWVVTPFVELTLAALLVIAATAKAANLLAVPLVALFVILLASDDRPAFTNCGCSGAEPVPVPRHAFLARTLGVLAVAVVAALLALVRSPSWGAMDVLVAGAVTFAPAHVLGELPLILHIHRVERERLPERVQQAKRAMIRVPAASVHVPTDGAGA